MNYKAQDYKKNVINTLIISVLNYDVGSFLEIRNKKLFILSIFSVLIYFKCSERIAKIDLSIKFVK